MFEQQFSIPQQHYTQDYKTPKIQKMLKVAKSEHLYMRKLDVYEYNMETPFRKILK